MQSDRLDEKIEAAQTKLDEALEAEDEDAIHRIETELSRLRREEERGANTEQDLLDQIKASRLSGDQVTTRRLEQQVAEQRAKRNQELGTAAEEEEKLPRVSLPGAVKALSHGKWSCLNYNSRSEMPVFRVSPPCKTAHTSFPAELADEDFTSIVCTFRDEGFLLGYENAVKAALRVSTMECFDPVKDYLDALKWDGVERLPLFLWACFGANTDPEEEPGERAKEAKWISTISVKWPISAVARVYDPGCQVDTVLIAESPLQGTRKSSAFRALAVRSDWFASDLPDIKHKDSVHHLLGPWIIELDELDALNRKEATSIKGFISRRVDRARLSYRKNTANYARRVVFCGTTNEDVYNSDATGGRRFWPFKVRETIDIDLIEEWRDQIWAEAVHRYKAKESWWFSDSELETIAHEEQSKRFKGGVHQEFIQRYIEGEETVSVDDILGSLGIAVENRGQMHQNEVARALQHLGWRRRRVTENIEGKSKRVWRYVRPLPLHKKVSS